MLEYKLFAYKPRALWSHLNDVVSCHCSKDVNVKFKSISTYSYSMHIFPSCKNTSVFLVQNSQISVDLIIILAMTASFAGSRSLLLYYTYESLHHS